MLIEGLIIGGIVYCLKNQRKLSHRVCNKCGSFANVRHKRINNTFVKTTYICQHCGNKWTKTYRE